MGVLEDSRIAVTSDPQGDIATAELRPGGRPTPTWSRLQFEMQHQQETYWCWAATSVSVSRFYESRSDWTQCGMANAELKQRTCCHDGATPKCNVTNVLDSPLQRAEVLERWQKGTLSFDELQREIDAGRPVAWRIEWPDQTGHFAVIEGYQNSERRLVAVEDPWTGSVDIPFDTLLAGRYPGQGRWTHSYFTHSPGDT
jgi:hypothetical protein